MLDAALDPDNAASNAGSNLLLGLAAMGGGAAFKLLRLLSSKFRKVCNSFDGSTLVSTEFGLREIQQIQIGEYVWAYNEKTGQKSLQEVVHLIQREGLKELVDIQLASGDVITATAGHPLYTPEKPDDQKWTDAGQLTINDVLQSITNSTVNITNVYEHEELAKVYNLTVANDHTYFVGVDRVLGHNAGICPDNINPKSILQFGHTFLRHGQGNKVMNKLIGRIQKKGPQGQWLDNKRASEFLAVLSHGVTEFKAVRIPLGLGHVIVDKHGRTLPAQWAVIGPKSSGLKTSFPVLADHKLVQEAIIGGR